MKEKEGLNIQIRGERARNIIGQVPPLIVKNGITVMFLVFVSIIISSSFFKLQPNLTVDAVIYGKDENSISYVLIPHKILYYENPYIRVSINPNLTSLYIDGIIDLDKKIEFIDNKGIHWKVSVSMNSYFSDSTNVFLEGQVMAKCKIKLKKTSVLDWLISKFTKSESIFFPDIGNIKDENVDRM